MVLFSVENRQGFALADVSAFGFFPAEPPAFPFGLAGRFEGDGFLPKTHWEMKEVWKIG